jgi:hypothetical protein
MTLKLTTKDYLIVDEFMKSQKLELGHGTQILLTLFLDFYKIKTKKKVKK